MTYTELRLAERRALAERVSLLNGLIANFKSERFQTKEDIIASLEAWKEEYEATLKD